MSPASTDPNRKSPTMMMKFVLGAVAALAVGGSALAAPAPVDLSGDWVLQSDPMAVPVARATPAGARRAAELSARKQWIDAPQGSPEYATTWCTHQGMPWQQTTTLPIAIVQGKLEVMVISPVRSDRRHIYTDGQRHPDPDAYDPTTVGHSIGRWQGKTLVVDTVGFSDKGVLLIPGGGVRGPNSRLVERYQLVDADTLRVTSTWTDRDSLRAPHTYSYVYKRATEPVLFRDTNCYALQAARAKGLHLPAGSPLY